MNKQNIKKYMLAGLFCILLLIWIGVKIFAPQYRKNSGNKENTSDNQNYYNTIFHPKEEDDTTYSDETSAELLKIHYEVKDIMLSKEIDDKMKDYIFYPEVKIENGKIVNEWSLAVITVNIKNNQEREDVLSLNNSRVRITEGEEFVESFEAFYLYPSADGSESKTMFHLELVPDEEREFQVYYVFKDKYLDNRYTLNYFINPAGLDSEHLPSPEDDPERYFANINFKEFIDY